MKVRRFGFGDFYDGLDVFDRIFSIPSLTFHGELVDTDKFDITPKKTYIEQQIKDKEAEIEQNERNHEASQRYYQEVKKRLQEEKEKLVMQRGKLNP